MKKIFFVGILLFLGSFPTEITAQVTRVYTTDLRWYDEGLDLFGKEKFSAAMRAFEKTRQEIDDPNSEVYVNATYYKALCALNLFHKDAEFQLKLFIQDYPESPKVKNAYFQLGKYNYRKRKWEKVVYWFSKSDVFDFTNEELFEYNFRMGYALFRLERYDKSAPYFHELIDIQNPYYAPSNYFYAHIAYLEGNYATALTGFDKLRTDKKFKVVIPYYITQIYYHQEKFDELIAYAIPMLDNEKTKRKPEISKLVGDAWFTKKEYKKAIPYLRFYIKEGEQPTRDEYFQLAYAQLMDDDCESATKYFSRISAKDDELAQKAVYNMAKCYLKTDNKPYARNAFLKAHNMPYNAKISEESLLNYAKLSYELAYDPYSDAITAFITYLEKYPNAIRKDEAFGYLVNIYLSTKNYRAALASLETTKELDPRLREVYQQLQFNLAVEQYQNGQYKNAIESFKKSQAQPENKTLYAQSAYWIAEAYFQLKKYPQAAEEYQKFIFEPRAFLLPEFKLANYSLGYTFYKDKDYNNGAKWFRKFLSYPDVSSERKHDALLRTGDCFFITKQYLLSEEYYQKAVMDGGKHTDYALYQYAVTQGLLKKKSSQITALEKLLSDYPTSTYAKGALYELGKNYMVSGNNEAALANFSKVISDEGANPFRKRALENIGLIYYNTNQNEKSLEVFKQVVSEYPSYVESKSALYQIRLIYKSTGDIDSYEAFIDELDFMQVSDLALDSLTYASAEDFYMDNEMEKAIPIFNKYLDRFDHPIFADKAHFYLAECQYKIGDLNGALDNYAYNVNSNNLSFYRPSLKRAAELSYKLEKYAIALNYFEELKKAAMNTDELNEIHWWKLQSASKIDSNRVVIEEGNILLTDSLLDTKRKAEILFLMANSYRSQAQENKAIAYYYQVNELTQEQKSATSLLYIAEMLYAKELVDSSEAVIFQIAQHTPTYPDELAQGLILLSDIYVMQENYFQARTTLESVVDNYDRDPEILNVAKQKLNYLTELENSAFDEEKEPIEDEVDLEGADDINDDLFDDEKLEEEEIPTPQKLDEDE